MRGESSGFSVGVGDESSEHRSGDGSLDRTEGGKHTDRRAGGRGHFSRHYRKKKYIILARTERYRKCAVLRIPLFWRARVYLFLKRCWGRKSWVHSWGREQEFEAGGTEVGVQKGSGGRPRGQKSGRERVAKTAHAQPTRCNICAVLHHFYGKRDVLISQKGAAVSPLFSDVHAHYEPYAAT